MRATYEAVRLFNAGQAALAEVEARGLRVDLDYLRNSESKTEVAIAEIDEQLRATDEYRQWSLHYGTRTNLNSRGQLSVILYRVMGINTAENSTLFKEFIRTSGGVIDAQSRAKWRDKANERALMEINSPFTKLYLLRAKLEKLNGTYFRGVLKETTAQGFVHPVYNLNVVDTYRSSCRNPNWQNVPKRNKVIAKQARRIYIPRDGFQIVEVDYSQLEVRIAACYHNDPVMLAYLLDNTTCMHRDTAAQLFGLSNPQVSDLARDIVKNMFVFPQFYGSIYTNCAASMWKAMKSFDLTVEGSATTLEEHLAKQGITSRGACDFETEPEEGTFESRCLEVQNSFWLERFTVYTEWKESWFREYLDRGCFRMATGFVCRHELSRNQVINYPVQGAAFHCLLQSLVLIQKELKRRKMRSRIIGQIHDSLVGEVWPPEFDEYTAICRHVMTVELPRLWKWLTVPLKVGIEYCEPDEAWSEKKKLK